MIDLRLNQLVPEKWKGDAGAGRVVLYDANGNPLSRAEKVQLPANAQGMPIQGVNDGITRFARADRFGSLATSFHNPLFHDDFEGATTNVQKWLNVATTFTQVHSNAGLQLNSSASVAVSQPAFRASLLSAIR